MATYLDQSLSMLKTFEGCVPWMYRDTVGKITVGVGFMLPNTNAATALPFQCCEQPATQDVIAAEFARVMALEQGKVASFYRNPESPELGQTTIDAKLLTILQGFEATLRTAFPQYDTFPDGAKLALLDMAYNLGPQGLLKGYPKLVAAVQQQNWVQASLQCMREGPSGARNDWTKQQFLSAVATSTKASAEGRLARAARRVRGLSR